MQTFQIEYDGTKLINGMIEHRKINGQVKGRGDMKIKLEKLDPFWLDFVRKNNLGVGITKAWVHYMDSGADHETAHVHEPDTCVFYLRVPENSGNLVFDGEIITPKEGMLVIVPGGAHHAITKNRSEETRYALAFWIE